MHDILYLLIIFPIESVLNFIYQYYRGLFWIDGIAIILLSITVSILTLPLYNMAESWQNTERDIQKRMKKKLDDIKAVFRGSERHMIIRTFYRQNNYHPVYSLRSVLGLAIQVPFFIAAYHYLGHLDSLKDASYYFIPNLSKPDALLNIHGFSINLLPIAMTLINLASAGVYAKKLTQRELVQLSGMAVLFLVLLYNSPSGLVLYWTMNNVCSLIKNLIYVSVRPKVVFTRVIYSFLFFIFVYSLLLRFQLFKNAAGLADVRIYSSKLWWQNLKVACIVICILFIAFSLKSVSRFIDMHCNTLNQNPNLRKRIFVLSCVVLFFMAGLVIPSSLISSSTQEFSQSFQSLTNPLVFLRTVSLQALGFFIIFPFSAYALFKERVKQNLTLLAVCLTTLSLLHAYIFRGDYGIILSNLKFDSPDLMNHGFPLIFLNIFAAVIASALVIYAVKKKYYIYINTILTVIILSCAAMCIINSVRIIDSHNEYRKIMTQLKTDTGISQKPGPVFNFSKTKNNVLIIMLDQAIGSYFGEIIQNDATISPRMKGFIWYPNTAAFNGHTLLALPPLFGGYEYTPLEINKRSAIALVEKHNESLLVMPLLFQKEGYHAIFTDPTYANYSDTPDRSIFISKNIKSDLLIGKYSARWIEKWMQRSSPDSTSDKAPSADDDSRSFLEKNLINFSLFRISPAFIRKYMYDNGFWNNANYRYSIKKSLHPQLVANYSALDYLPEISKFDSHDNELIIVVNELTHISQPFNSSIYEPGSKKQGDEKTDYTLPFNDSQSLNRFSANITAMQKLNDWFDVLKKEGVYDNTKIIIVSDHGFNINSSVFKNITEDPGLNKSYAFYNPLLLVKDFARRSDLQVSNEFMTTADVPSIAASHLKNPVNPFSGKSLRGHSKKNGIKIITAHIWDWENHNKNTFKISDDEIITVRENIFNRKNWQGIVR